MNLVLVSDPNDISKADRMQVVVLILDLSLNLKKRVYPNKNL